MTRDISSARSAAGFRLPTQSFTTSPFLNNGFFSASGMTCPSFGTPYWCELWFKAGKNIVSPISAALMSWGNTTLGTQFIRLYFGATGTIQAQVRNDSSTTLMTQATTKTYADATWHHIVWVDNLGTCQLYVDGTLESTSFSYSQTGALTLDQVALGTLLRGSSGTGNMVGKLLGFRTYVGTTPTAAQVLDRYAGRAISLVPNLIWDAQDGSGTTVVDTSGNGHDGSLTTGAITWTTDTPTKLRSAATGRVAV